MPTLTATTSDLDEANEILATHFYGNVLDVLHPPADLRARFDVTRCGPVTIGEIGFAHLGRFAGAYRDRYGVAPSDTLRG